MLLVVTLISSFARDDLVITKNHGYCRVLDVQVFQYVKIDDEVVEIKYLCANSKEQVWLTKFDIMKKVGEIHGKGGV